MPVVSFDTADNNRPPVVVGVKPARTCGVIVLPELNVDDAMSSSPDVATVRTAAATIAVAADAAYSDVQVNVTVLAAASAPVTRW